MCGIAGAAGACSKAEAEAVVRRMLARMTHRGPDDEGVLALPGAAIGNRRLSIIDLPGGSQPVWNETRTCAVVFNGEIYNFRELRASLEKSGHRFRTHSDTETIVHAYEEWGEDCLRRLRGMFALALLEAPGEPAAPASRIFLARDPLGIKPLYYANVPLPGSGGDIFLFASELRALLATGLLAANLSGGGLASYCLFGSVIEPAALVQGVSSLPPGYCLAISPADPGRAKPKQYWSFDFVRQDRGERPSRGDAKREVRTRLEQAVASHVVSDVPLGVFLSSGMDSTAIAALAARARNGIRTLTLGFPETMFDERAAARRAAEQIGSHHTEINLSAAEMATRVEESLRAFDQPSMDGVNTFLVSWAAKQTGWKVALSGLGGDELFGGYRSFQIAGRLRLVALVASLVPGAVRKAVQLPAHFIAALSRSPDALRKGLAVWLDPSSLPDASLFARLLFTPETVSRFLPRDEITSNHESWRGWLQQAAQEAEGADRFTAVSWLELRSYMASTLLRDTDAMSMHHSLEVRVPFLDLPLVEYALGLPMDVKREASRPKSLLRDALQDTLPAEARLAAKRTFTLPWDVWLRGPLARRMEAEFAAWAPELEEHIPGKFAGSVWHEFTRRRTSWSRPWSLFVLNNWVRQNLHAPSASFVPSGSLQAANAHCAADEPRRPVAQPIVDSSGAP